MPTAVESVSLMEYLEWIDQASFLSLIATSQISQFKTIIKKPNLLPMMS